jgi:Fe-S oxidoreductase/nitrate reductase gamma subunit
MSAQATSGPAPTSLTEKMGQRLKSYAPPIGDFLTHAVGQVRILKKAYPGLMHAMIFWGVTIQILGTGLNLLQMQLFVPFVEMPFPRGNLYLAYELIMDLAGLAILVGVSMAAVRRFILKPRTLETRWDDIYALGLLALIPLVGYSTEALRLVSASPPWAGWSPIGDLVANLFQFLGLTSSQAALLHGYFFWGHVTLGLTFVASIPFTKLRHLVMAPLNIALRDRRKDGVLEKIENIEEAEILGVGNVGEFKPSQLLSFDACVRCGRCEEVCPASISGMDYSPRAFIQSLREAAFSELVQTNGKLHSDLIGSAITEQTPWVCTTCGACLTGCPAFVNPVDEILDFRRYLSLTTGQIPKTVAEVLRNMERQGNPWGIAAEDRTAWIGDLEVKELAPGDETDVLLFVGCAFAFDERNKKVLRAFVNVLNRSGVDFGILGLDEMCCGETARRLGHEYLFQVFAEQNIQTFNQVKFKRIVTQCPHCFNTLKNEYPQMGSQFMVQHYTQYLAEIGLPTMRDRVNGNTGDSRLAYHDSCYLGRYNQIYDQPRALIDQIISKRVELVRHGEDSMCCGGGGGQMWLETDPNTRINHKRFEDVLQAGVDIVATACPYCLLMFDDAIRTKGMTEKVEVLDIAEVIEKKLSSDV